MKDFNKALNYSFLLLKYRARSKGEIISRLKKKGYDSSLIEQIINYLQKNNYINDIEFTRLFTLSCQEKGWGPKRINFKLKKLGISEDLIEQVLKDKKIFQEKIKELIEQKLKYYRGPKKYQNILRFLATRGFAYEDIHAALEELGIDRYEDG